MRRAGEAAAARSPRFGLFMQGFARAAQADQELLAEAIEATVGHDENDVTLLPSVHKELGDGVGGRKRFGGPAERTHGGSHRFGSETL